MLKIKKFVLFYKSTFLLLCVVLFFVKRGYTLGTKNKNEAAYAAARKGNKVKLP